MKFSPEQIAWLKADLLREHVATRSQSGRSLSYIEGWHAISEANRIFGFDGWCSETVDIRMVSERQRKIGQSGTDGWGVSYVARVRITVGPIIREGVGSGHGIDRDCGQAHESAIKEAETDARKRALMTFGNQFGLALYDKTQANVSDEQPRPQPVSQPAALPAAVSLSQPKKEETTRASNPVDVRKPDPSAAARPAAQSRAAAIPTVKPTQSRAAAVAEKPYSAESADKLIKGLAALKRQAQNAKTIVAIRGVSRDHEAWKMTANACRDKLTGLDLRRVKAEQEILEITIRDTFAVFEEAGKTPLAAE